MTTPQHRYFSGYQERNQTFLGVLLPSVLPVTSSSGEGEVLKYTNLFPWQSEHCCSIYRRSSYFSLTHQHMTLYFIFHPLEQAVKRTLGQPFKFFLKFLDWLLTVVGSPPPETQTSSVSYQILTSFHSVKVRKFHPNGEVLLRYSVDLSICIVRLFITVCIRAIKHQSCRTLSEQTKAGLTAPAKCCKAVTWTQWLAVLPLFS